MKSYWGYKKVKTESKNTENKQTTSQTTRQTYKREGTRGNSLKIVNIPCHYDLRKYSFCNKITNVWNSLPEDIVTAASVNSFFQKWT